MEKSHHNSQIVLKLTGTKKKKKKRKVRNFDSCLQTHLKFDKNIVVILNLTVNLLLF